MSPINTLSVLGFASAALAVPYHGHGHPMHHHGGHHKPSGFSVFPYPSANGTAIGSTGFATGTAAPTNYAPQPVGPASGSVAAAASESATTIVEPSTYFNAASGTICTTDVTVTSKVQVTVTVTADAEESATSSEVAPAEATSSSASSSRARSTQYVTATLTQQRSSSAAAPSSSEAAPVESSPAASSSATPSSSAVAPPVYSAPASSSSVADAVTESSSSAESTSAVMPTLTYSEAKKQPAYTSSSSAAPTQSSSYGGNTGSGKRGVAYNDASLTECFMNNPKITWGYNWGSSSSGLSSSVNYIPQLWDGTSTFTDSWEDNAKAAIKAGSTHLFSFNEPDLTSQANMTPEEAAAAYKQYMDPLASDTVKLCAPAVTNGGGAMGLTWLQNFLHACSDCTIDCVNVHWYDSAENTDYFTKHIQNATEIAGGKPVFVSEFGATGSDDQISTFLGTVMDWMDKEDSVAGYAYFMVSDGKLVTGTEPSSYGKVYAS